MKKTIALLAALLLALVPLAGCRTMSPEGGMVVDDLLPAATTPSPAAPGAEGGDDSPNILPVAFKPASSLTQDISAALSGFSVDLFRRVAGEDAGKNVFLSPLSVWLALSMTYNGAAGETAEGMAKALRAQGIALKALNGDNAGLMGLLTAADPAVRIAIANSIWMRKGTQEHIKEDFLERNGSFYGAEIGELDFSDPNAAGTINRWVEDNTNGNIKDLVEPPIHPMTVMFLINAIHFKAPWAVAFDEKRTYDGTFAADGTETAARYLFREEGNVGLANGDVTAARLPYASGRLEMVALKPEKQTLAAFIAGLTPERLNQWIESCKETSMSLALPKFKVEYELELNDILTAMGMEEAFSESADFTAMSADMDLYISKVKHKSFVEVNEEGTEASAATSVEMRTMGMAQSLNFNSPFLYVIRDTKTGAILFIGTMEKPE